MSSLSAIYVPDLSDVFAAVFFIIIAAGDKLVRPCYDFFCGKQREFTVNPFLCKAYGRKDVYKRQDVERLYSSVFLTVALFGYAAADTRSRFSHGKVEKLSLIHISPQGKLYFAQLRDMILMVV